MTTGDIVSLLSLTLMEITLCIDNAIFISILAGRVPGAAAQKRARFLGILISLAMNIIMIALLGLLKGLDKELFNILNHGFSGKQLIMLAGGFFLLTNSVVEMHNKLEGEEHTEEEGGGTTYSIGKALGTIAIMNFVFSLDSVLAAVGMTKETWIMITSIVAAMAVMFFFAKPIGKFVEKHPTTKMLALSFLMLIGLTLIIDGFGIHLEKGFVYSAMLFSLFVEFINLRLKKTTTPPVRLREPRLPDDPIVTQKERNTETKS